MSFDIPYVGLTGGDPTETSSTGLQATQAYNAAVDSQQASDQGNTGFVFNPAQDSQKANVENNLSAVTTDDTIPKKAFKLNAYQPVNFNSASQKTAPMKAQHVDGPTDASYAALVQGLQSQMAQSSKSVKTRGATQAAVQSGMRGTDPVNTNGVHIAAIQELNKQIDALSKRIAAIKAKQGGAKSTPSKGA